MPRVARLAGKLNPNLSLLAVNDKNNAYGNAMNGGIPVLQGVHKNARKHNGTYTKLGHSGSLTVMLRDLDSASYKKTLTHFAKPRKGGR